jgi:4-amino-4-deoxy-L-arabinose transferase-like glycosyltransferase
MSVDSFDKSTVVSNRSIPANVDVLRKLPSIYLYLIPIGTAGAILLAWLTPFGVGIYVDTLYYVSSARNLIAGIGMGRVTGLGTFKPMTHYPPFYSQVLAFFHLLGVNELSTARWISILAFGLTIILVGLIVYQRTNSRFFSVFSAVLVLLSNPILRNFSWAMTEPLYIVLMLFSLLYLGVYLHNSLRCWLIGTAIFASLSLLTRYVGFSLVGAFILVLVFNRQQSWRRRLQDLAIFLSISLVPILIWLVRNWLVSETLTNRVLNWHPISAENVSFLIKAVNSWGLLPQRLLVNQETFVFTGLIIGIALVSLFWLVRTLPKPEKSPDMEFVILLAGWSYTTLLIISLFFLDATTRLENRILLPLYVLILLLIIIGSALLWQRNSLLLRLSVVLICLWLAYFSFTRVDGAIADLRSDGQGYASLNWQNSPTADFIRQQDASLIYSNDVTAIYFLAGKDSVAIPNANSTEADIAKMREYLRASNSFLVIFGPLTGEFTPFDQLTQNLTLVGSFEDGKIYQLR